MKYRLSTVALILMNLMVATSLLLVVTKRLSRARVRDSDSRARLNRGVGDLAFDGIPLDQALRALGARTGATILMSPNIQRRPPAPSVGGWEFVGEQWRTPIHVHFHGASLHAALDALMRQAQHAFTVPLTYEALDDGSIFVGADDEMPQIVRAYPVQDLLDMLNHVEMRQAPLGTLLEGEMPTSGRERLQDILMESIDPDVWNATQPVIELRAGRLIMIHDRRWCDHVDGVVQELRKIRPTPAHGAFQ
jgi:hypothetical protein